MTVFERTVLPLFVACVFDNQLLLKDVDAYWTLYQKMKYGIQGHIQIKTVVMGTNKKSVGIMANFFYRFTY